jgi:hypothetical protein
MHHSLCTTQFDHIFQKMLTQIMETWHSNHDGLPDLTSLCSWFELLCSWFELLCSSFVLFIGVPLSEPWPLVIKNDFEHFNVASVKLKCTHYMYT